MIANSRLRALLDKVPAGEITVPYAYVMFVAGGFKDVEGCLFFREYAPGKTTAAGLPQFGDATGYEASVNGHHLIDHLERDDPKDAVTLAHVTLACVRFLAKRLRSVPGPPCHVIFSVREGDATIRFHRVREAEPPWHLDLESYADEALGTVDTTDEDLGTDEPATTSPA